MKQYECHKLVHAEPMTDVEYDMSVQNNLLGAEMARADGEQEGYHVIYSKGKPDEYHSWSPKKAFDEGYTEIDDGTPEPMEQA